MATDNLKFRKPHMTFIDGYFYMFDDDTDMLLQKTDDGITAFSYPFDTLMTETMLSIEYDGVNFWSLHDGSSEQTLVINRWRIENYACKLKDTLTLSNSGHNFNGEAFTVEHYHCTISGSYLPGDTIITVDTDDGELPGELLSGMAATIGPNSEGKFETINIQHVDHNVVTFADPLENDYSDGQEFKFYNNIWLFNNSNELDTSNGALYKLNAYSGSILFIYPGGVYKDVKATTFSEISHFIDFGTVNSLMYVKASNLLFVDITSSVNELSYYGSMAMDTIENDDISIITVYDISVFGKNVYRLQKKATYFGETSSWGNYNYQAATFNQLVSSISMTATPNIIAANEVSVSELTARVKDQFLQPIAGRLIYFSVATESTGVIVDGQEYVNTDSDGLAVSTYRSGLDAELVQIIARVQQV
jgi:hypothetical protein